MATQTIPHQDNILRTTRTRPRRILDSINRRFRKLDLSFFTPNEQDNTARRDTYQYMPLPPGKWMRLLCLLPAARKSKPLEVSIFTCELKNAPPYEAISYVWGDMKHKSEIVVEGKSLMIQTSLYEALQQFRDATSQKVFWADGVCIDQSNIAERGHQVQFMRMIFQEAKHVRAWLGIEVEEYAATAFKFIEYFVDQYEKDY